MNSCHNSDASGKRLCNFQGRYTNEMEPGIIHAADRCPTASGTARVLTAAGRPLRYIGEACTSCGKFVSKEQV